VLSVRNTAVFSCALPTNTTPSSPLKWCRCSAITASFRCPGLNRISGIPWRATNSSSFATKLRVIGLIKAADGQRITAMAAKEPNDALFVLQAGHEDTSGRS
jgi:hypothetical protein